MTFQRAAKAGIWSTLELLAGQSVNFIAIIFLARILSPTDFGVFAFVVLTVMVCTTFVTGGLSSLIIQRNNLTDQDLDRIFTAALLLSLALAGVIAALGPILAHVYGHPILADIMPAVCFQPFIVSLGMIQSALFNKKLHFAPMAKIALFSGSVAGAIAVFLAYQGFGIWALAAQMLVSATISSALIWGVGDTRPSLNMNLKPLLPMLRFAAPISVAQALTIFYAQGAALIVGKRFSAADVGLFNRGHGVAHLPNQIFNGLVGKVALPLFSELGEDNEAIRHGMKRGTESVMLVSAPAFVGLAVLSPELLELLYGANWVGAAPVLTILALSGILMPLQSTNMHLLLAKGMSRTFFRVEIAKKAIGTVLILTTSFYGITALACGFMAANTIALFLNTRYTYAIIGLGLLEQLRNVLGVLLTAITMGVVVWIFVEVSELGLVSKTLTAILIGVATYLFVGFASGLGSFQRAIRDARMFVQRAR